METFFNPRSLVLYIGGLMPLSDLEAFFFARDFQFDVAGSTTELLRFAQREPERILIIERTVNGEDLLPVVAGLRSAGIRLPLIMLAATGGPQDRVLGLEAGADNYLIMPFSLAELGARAEASSRRLADTRPTTLRVGSLKVDLIDRTCTRGLRSIDLLPMEFELLVFFMKHPDAVIPSLEIIDGVWKNKPSIKMAAFDNQIVALQSKLSIAEERPLIVRRRGTGIFLDSSASVSQSDTVASDAVDV